MDRFWLATTRLAGIIFVLRSGIPWEMLPQELLCGSGMTCCVVCATDRKREFGD
jgi:hypothetical protein